MKALIGRRVDDWQADLVILGERLPGFLPMDRLARLAAAGIAVGYLSSRPLNVSCLLFAIFNQRGMWIWLRKRLKN